MAYRKLNLMTAHHQWATRPADERFWNLGDLRDFLESEVLLTRSKTLPFKDLRAIADNGDVCLAGPQGNPAQLTHWSFQQVCSTCRAPANYLRELPSELAVTNINYGLKILGNDGSAESNLLFRNNGSLLIRSVTSEEYGRIWNRDVVRRLNVATEHGWVTPPARPAVDDPRARPATEQDVLPNQGDFGLSVKVGDMIAPAGVYCGDRDMFVFLVNPDRIIDDGGTAVMRGVFVWNSEVGAGAFKIRSFYLENVCGNHICWGASNVFDLKIVHRHGSIRDYGPRMAKALRQYSDQGDVEEKMMIRRAKEHVLGDNREEVVESLYGKKSLGLARRDIEESFNLAVQFEDTAKAPPTTAWGFVHGLTRYSQFRPYANERNNLDRIGGRILQMAAGGKSY